MGDIELDLDIIKGKGFFDKKKISARIGSLYAEPIIIHQGIGIHFSKFGVLSGQMKYGNEAYCLLWSH